MKESPFENILLSEHIESCLVLLPVCSFTSNNLLGFSLSFLPVDLGDILQRAPFQNL